MNLDKLSALLKERDELKDIQRLINNDGYVLALYTSGGYAIKVLEDSYKSMLNTVINTKLSDIEYKTEETIKELLV